MFDIIKMKVSMVEAWTGGRAFMSSTVRGKKENCLWSMWHVIDSCYMFDGTIDEYDE